MPNGYTANIYDGKEETLAEFLRHNARGMMPYIMQRDESWKEPLKARTIPDYYFESVEEAKQEVERLTNLTADEIEEEYQNYKRQAEEAHDDGVKRNVEIAARYDERIAEVEALDWPEDTEDTGGFWKGYRDFVMSNLTESRSFDVHTEEQLKSWYSPYKDAEDWYADTLSAAAKRLAYRKNDLAKQQMIVKTQNVIHNQLVEFLQKLS